MNEQEWANHIENMHAALAFFEEWAECQDYGAFPGGDPRLFRPDPEASTEAERTAHKTACEAWERGECPTFDVGPLNSEAIHTHDRNGEPRTIQPGAAFVNVQVFGLGTITRRDEDMTRARDGLRLALNPLVPT